MTKVLHIRWGEKIGGVETLLKYLAKFSDKSKFESVFCFLKGGGGHEEFIREQSRQVIVIPASSGFDIGARFRLFWLLRKVRPDVVVEHGLPPLIRLVIRLAGRFPIVTYDHGCFELYKIKRKHFSNWLIKLEYQFCSNFIIANSNYNKRTIIDNYKVKPEKVEIIFPGVDTDLFKPITDVRDRGTLKVGYVGRVQFGDKGTDLLLQVARELIHNDYTNFEIHVYGDGPDMSTLVKLVEDASLAAYFKFHGEVTDIPTKLLGIDVVVVTSKSEAFGLSPLEALSTGRSVVCFDVGGLRESVGQCNQATLVEPNNAVEMARAIADIGRRGTSLEADALAAHNYVADNFSVVSFVRNMDRSILSKL